MAEHEHDQRTEEATPRRREEAREKGQVPLSTELVAAVLLAAWVFGLWLFGPRLAAEVGGLTAACLVSLAALGTGELDLAQCSALILELGKLAGGVLLGLVAPILLVGIAAGYAQIGFRVTPNALALDASRIDPLKGLERLFGARTLVRTALALAKIALIAGAMVAVAWGQRAHIAALAGGELGPVLQGIGHVVLRCTAGALAAVLALALLDLAFQKLQHARDLRMTKQEVKEELRSTEGDPHLKSRIRRVQREMATRRMMADVPRATVVVTNPTHYAVALRYGDEERERKSAPRVVAKGVDRVALRIKELALEAGVVCYEDVPLARTLHAQCEIGDQVPVALYEAVAGVLAYVYRVQGDSALRARAAAPAGRAGN
jgi:flagellar biosynthetic protein FlhB